MQVKAIHLTQIRQILLLLCAVFIISACATKVINANRIMLNEHISYVLQPIPETLVNKGVQAHFTVTQKGKENSFLIQAEMTSSSLVVSGMTAEGLSLFTLNWDSKLGTLTYDKKIAIEPQRVLAELQLVMWPLTDVNHGLEFAKIKIITESYREIISNDTVVYQIKEQGNISHLINLEQNYSIRIEELDRW